MNVIEVENLRRSYPAVKGMRRKTTDPLVALDGVDLTVGRGEIHGLLGPNGAGKTTLCKVLSTVLLPTSGTVRVLGYDVVTQARALRPHFGIVFGGDRGLYGKLTARQNLSHWGALYGLRGGRLAERVDRVLDRVGLTGRADQRAETFSRGMKQRLHLARGLVHEPSVLFLDEPTTGMDPVAARDFRTLVRELRADGRTVLLTTHDMAEAEELCDQVTLIDGGRVVANAQPGSLADWLGRYERVTARGVPAELLPRLRELPGVGEVRTQEDGTLVVDVRAAGAGGQVLRLLLDAGVTSVATAPPSLEEFYLHLVGDRGMAVAG